MLDRPKLLSIFRHDEITYDIMKIFFLNKAIKRILNWQQFVIRVILLRKLLKQLNFDFFLNFCLNIHSLTHSLLRLTS